MTNLIHIVILSTFVTTNQLHRAIPGGYNHQPIYVWSGERRVTNYIVDYYDETNHIVKIQTNKPEMK